MRIGFSGRPGILRELRNAQGGINFCTGIKVLYRLWRADAGGREILRKVRRFRRNANRRRCDANCRPVEYG
jgi:hypothetical protein